MYRPPLPPEPRLTGAGGAMRQIRTSKPNLLWLQGPGPTDFWTWTDETGAVQEHELTFFNRTVVWRAGQILTGLSHDGYEAGVLGRSGQLDFDTRLDPLTLSASLIVLGSIPASLRSAALDAFARAIQDALSRSAPASSGAR